MHWDLIRWVHNFWGVLSKSRQLAFLNFLKCCFRPLVILSWKGIQEKKYIRNIKMGCLIAFAFNFALFQALTKTCFTGDFWVRLIVDLHLVSSCCCVFYRFFTDQLYCLQAIKGNASFVLSFNILCSLQMALEVELLSFFLIWKSF